MNLQETLEKVKPGLKDLEEYMEKHKAYDQVDCNLIGSGLHNDAQKPLGLEDKNGIMETLSKIPLREFMAKSGAITTAGLAGSNYLIPVKVHQILYSGSAVTDIVPQTSIAVLGPEEIPGTTLNVDIIVDNAMKVRGYSSGGKMAAGQLQTIQATLDFSRSYGLDIPITNDLIEDSKFSLIELAIRLAGEECGEEATDMHLAIMKTGTDGDGTLNINAVTGDANETKFIGGTTNDIVDCITADSNDGFVPDTWVTTHGTITHSVLSTSGAAGNDSPLWANFLTSGYPKSLAGMNVYYADTNTMTNNKTPDNEVTLIFSKNYSVLAGRKRWLRIENYSDPLADLVGATVTFRQDSLTIYNDSIAYMYET
jgi:HK97 family phage major capsid protein